MRKRFEEKRARNSPVRPKGKNPMVDPKIAAPHRLWFAMTRSVMVRPSNERKYPWNMSQIPRVLKYNSPHAPSEGLRRRKNPAARAAHVTQRAQAGLGRAVRAVPVSLLGDFATPAACQIAPTSEKCHKKSKTLQKKVPSHPFLEGPQRQLRQPPSPHVHNHQRPPH